MEITKLLVMLVGSTSVLGAPVLVVKNGSRSHELKFPSGVIRNHVRSTFFQVPIRVVSASHLRSDVSRTQLNIKFCVMLLPPPIPSFQLILIATIKSAAQAPAQSSDRETNSCCQSPENSRVTLTHPARGPLKKMDPLIVDLNASADANALTCFP